MGKVFGTVLIDMYFDCWVWGEPISAQVDTVVPHRRFVFLLVTALKLVSRARVPLTGHAEK